MLAKQPFARRIVIAFTLMTLLVSGMFSLGIVAVVYSIESQLVTEDMGREMDTVLHEDLPSGQPPRLDARTLFFSTALPEHPLPDGFAALAEGFTEVVRGNEAYYVYVRDLEHFSHFLLDRLLNAGGVADANSSFVLRTVKGFQALPLSQLEA